MANIYCIANRKGGCGKTTTVGALASGCSRLGLRVLVVDMDPQGNATDWAKVDSEGTYSAYDLVMGRCPIKEAIAHASRYDIIPGDKVLSNVEPELSTAQGREYRLKKVLEDVENDYDLVLIDTPPQLGLLSIIAVTAANSGVIVTTDAGAFATKGMSDLSEMLAQTREYHNPDANVVGILLTRFNSRYNLMKTMKEVTKKFAEYFDAPLYDTYIRASVGVMESQLDAIDLFDTTRVNPAMSDYANFCVEFLDKEGLLPEDSPVRGMEDAGEILRYLKSVKPQG